MPPCKYQILSEKEIKSEREPNNHTGTTKLIELSVEPLDLLGEFLKVMENPPAEYNYIRSIQGSIYEEALYKLKNYIENRNKTNSGVQKKKSNLQ